jgi:hypothetical protein
MSKNSNMLLLKHLPAVAQHPAQALAALDGAFGRQRAELWPEDLVFQFLMVSFLVIM